MCYPNPGALAGLFLWSGDQFLVCYVCVGLFGAFEIAPTRENEAQEGFQGFLSHIRPPR